MALRTNLLSLGVSTAGLVVATTLVASVLTSAQQPPAAPAGAYKRVENWPQLPADDPRFGTMAGVVVDGKGVIYGMNRDRGTVWTWDKSGKFLGDWGLGVSVFGHDLTYVPGEDVIWVADRDAHTVKKFALDGKLLMTIGQHETPGNDRGHFNGPSGVAVAANGDIFVSDGYWNSRIVKFNKDGKYLDEVGTPGREKWQFGLLHHIALSAGGRIFIDELCGYGGPVYYGRPDCGGTGPRSGPPSPYAARVIVLDTDFNWLETRPPRGVFTIKGDTIYTWTQQGVILSDARTGKDIETIAIDKPAAAHQIAVDAAGDIYLADENLGGQYTRARLGSKGFIRRYTRAAN